MKKRLNDDFCCCRTFSSLVLTIAFSQSQLTFVLYAILKKKKPKKKKKRQDILKKKMNLLKNGKFLGSYF